MGQFSWVSSYREIAEKVLEYEQRQAELVEILRSFEGTGIPVSGLQDVFEAGERGPLREIDLFTFFAFFNRGLKHENRRKIVSGVRARLGLSPDAPSDFDGIPVAQNQNWWFFPYAHERHPEDLPSLWRMAREALIRQPAELDRDLFRRCLAIRGVGTAKLTMGLFWINPDSFLSLDAVMIEHLRKLGVTVDKVASLEDYIRIVDAARSHGAKDFKTSSYEAWRASHDAGHDSYDEWDTVAEVSRELLSNRAEFDEEERNYKLEIARNVQTVIALLKSGGDLVRPLRTAFGPPNNLTAWQSHDRFVKWAEAVPDAARQALRTLLLDDQNRSLAGRIDAFIEAVPTEVLRSPGAKLSVTSFFLMGSAPEDMPAYKVKPFRIVETRLGALPPTSISSAGATDRV